MRFIKIIFLLIIPLISLAESNSNSIWNKANALYDNNSFDSASIYYRQLADEYKSVAILYNLGNTYYKLNDIGNAVLCYERALKQEPSNNKVLDNLYLTQNRIANRIQANEKIFFIRWWESITHSSNAVIWAILALIVFVGTMTSLILKKLNIISFNLPGQVLVGATVIWLLFLTFSIHANGNKHNGTGAIVMDNNAEFKTQPDVSKTSSLIPEGTKVTILHQKNSWVEIILPDGRKGWMNTEVLTKI